MPERRPRRPTRRTETLTQALAKLLEKELLPDLRVRAKAPAVAAVLERRWKHERERKRTAEGLSDWVDQALEQVGAAWILSCVFVRTLEDRGLLERNRLAGPGSADSEQYFFEITPELRTRDYLLTVFREIGQLPGAEELLGPAKNPAWRLSPSEEGARNLMGFFREAGDEGLKWKFAGEDTRFLGDLYQDLSASVRERYALLQTPDFVEQFILSLTLDPALKEFGLEGLKVIDPTCGSGHFVLGAYDRLFEERCKAEPGADPRGHAQAALGQVYGVDINPYAVAIARFRLTLSYVAKAGVTALKEVPKLPLNLVVADSLLHGGRGQRRLAELDTVTDRAGWHDELFTLDDEQAAKKVLGEGYHVVVGNPPYITCKDAALRELYRAAYPQSAAGKFALAAPFTERFFDLASEGGFVGLINANSFMKREFGKKLVETVLHHLDLTHVIDTSGAYIPGHGTPTVILAGRNRPHASDKVRAVLGKRGEPETPADPAKGKVWTSATRHLSEPGYENDFVSVVDMDRDRLGKHPWSLGGGGAAELKVTLEERSETRLSARVDDIGFASFIGLDDAFMMPIATARTRQIEPEVIRPIVVGEVVRDWVADPAECAIAPYSPIDHGPLAFDPAAQWARSLWPYRSTAEGVASFDGRSRKEEGQAWWQWYRWQPDRYRVPLRITFAFVATHNHFVLDRGGKVFNRSAPIIKLPASATEDDHLALLGYLNSSTACFWMKQVFFDKGNRGEGGGITADRWEKFYEYDGTKLNACPLPAPTPRVTAFARLLDEAGRRWSALDPAHVLEGLGDGGSPAGALEASRAARASVERRIRWLQEELDWELYRFFGLSQTAQTPIPSDLDAVPERAPGSRPADLLYARTVLDGQVTERFFTLCGLPSAAEVVGAPVAELDRTRLDEIAASKELQLIEHPAYKRTFRESFRAWDPQPALRQWLLDRVEERAKSETAQSARAVISAVLARPHVAEAAALLFGADADPQHAFVDLIETAAVPYLAAQRHSASGLVTRTEWEKTWDLQRREDAGEEVGDIPVPPKYGRADYASEAYWRLRGKLDVPKERFISYPGAEREGEGMLIGWAGWDHLQGAQALASLYTERRHTDGWPKEKLTPLLAGLWELVPWLKQWHDEPSPDHEGTRLGSYFEQFVQGQARELGLTVEDLRAWRP